MAKMTRIERAKQFLPFDALKGYKEAIMAKRKVVIAKKELSEDDAENLSYKFNQIKVGTIIKVIYFSNEEYVVCEGMVSKIDLDNIYDLPHIGTITEKSEPLLTIIDKDTDFKKLYEKVENSSRIVNQETI